MDDTARTHWNNIYAEKETDQLGWYEDRPAPSLNLIERCELLSEATILDVGAGASTLIDHVIERGYCNIIASDISSQALEKLKERLGEEKADCVRWVVDDITRPRQLDQLGPVDVWHDRAVLHFLHEDAEREAYLAKLRAVLRPGGYAIIAAFALDGAEMCSGLPVFRYDKDMLVAFLGNEFELVESFDHIYHQPWGDPRPFVYTHFRRT